MKISRRFDEGKSTKKSSFTILRMALKKIVSKHLNIGGFGLFHGEKLSYHIAV